MTSVASASGGLESNLADSMGSGIGGVTIPAIGTVRQVRRGSSVGTEAAAGANSTTVLDAVEGLVKCEKKLSILLYLLFLLLPQPLTSRVEMCAGFWVGSMYSVAVHAPVNYTACSESSAKSQGRAQSE